MKVKIEMKLTILEGEEEGRVFEETFVEETTTRHSMEYNIEELRLAWTYLPPSEMRAIYRNGKGAWAERGEKDG